MSDLYKRITTLCDNRKISAGQMCKDINLSRGIITDLKMGRKKNLSTDTLTKIANYFKVPINFLLGTPPFDFWEQIDTNRKTFLTNLVISEEALQMVWGIPADTEDMDISRLINLIDATVMSVSIDSEGNWITTLKKGIKKVPADGAEAKANESLERIYFNFAKEAQENEIDPRDIKDAIEMIKRLRNN